MTTEFVAEERRYEFRVAPAGSGPERVCFSDEGEVREFLQRVPDLSAFRSALEGGADLDDEDLRLEAAARISRGELRIVRKREEGMVPVAFEEEEEKAPVAAKREKTWIAFKVVEDATGRPVKGIKLKLTAPGGDEREAETDEKGGVEFTEIPEATCIAATSIEGATATNTFAFLKVGDLPARESEEEEDPSEPGPWFLARVEEHELGEIETIDSAAEANGVSWRDLARFNWGTDDRKEVDRILTGSSDAPEGEESTSATETESGQGEIPNSAPSIHRWLLIPKKFTLSAEPFHTYVLRVRPVLDSRLYLSLVLLDEEGAEPLPGKPYRIDGPDGETYEGTTDSEGFLEHVPVRSTFYRLTVDQVRVPSVPDTGGAPDFPAEFLPEQPSFEEEPVDGTVPGSEEIRAPVDPPEPVLGSVTVVVPAVFAHGRRRPQPLPHVLSDDWEPLRWEGMGTGYYTGLSRTQDSTETDPNAA